eukprot:6706472-Prymnesium_polylepis.2
MVMPPLRMYKGSGSHSPSFETTSARLALLMRLSAASTAAGQPAEARPWVGPTEGDDRTVADSATGRASARLARSHQQCHRVLERVLRRQQAHRLVLI